MFSIRNSSFLAVSMLLCFNPQAKADVDPAALLKGAAITAAGLALAYTAWKNPDAAPSNCVQNAVEKAKAKLGVKAPCDAVHHYAHKGIHAVTDNIVPLAIVTAAVGAGASRVGYALPKLVTESLESWNPLLHLFKHFTK